MIKFFERNSTKLTISEFYDNYSSQKYNFDASYQRKSDVWSEDKKSFLIDSILKNYPIPAIFMRPIVDDNGRTKYDVIDGKQRLQSIISFIKGNIPLTSYFDEDNFLDEKNKGPAEIIAGKYFEEIKQEKIASEYIKQFWTYTLQVEYLYEENIDLVSSVFDRLNRNGEPLNRQELRNAKYANTSIMKYIQRLADNQYWKDKLSRLKFERMEDEEFISELLFLILDKQVLDSKPDTLDEKYDQYKDNKVALSQARVEFEKIIQFIEELSLNYDNYKRVFWTSHLYTLFSVAWYCVEHKILSDQIKYKIDDFYTKYFSKNICYEGYLKEYKDACSSRTKSAIQRNKRMEAVLKYCDIKI